MLIMPDQPPIYRIFAIDPGTDTLGTAVLDVDLRSGSVTVIYVETLRGSRMCRALPGTIETHGERAAKLEAHQQQIFSMLHHFIPSTVISESPYMGRFPQAFRALVECLIAIRDAVVYFDPSMPLETVDPPTAKKAVGAPGKGGGKDAVREAVLQLKELRTAPGIDLGVLDEHSIDAIAVGYSKARSVVESLI